MTDDDKKSTGFGFSISGGEVKALTHEKRDAKKAERERKRAKREARFAPLPENMMWYVYITSSC